MCILFLLVGDQHRPTILCNNRDEMYFRPTERGRLSSDGSTYAPKDIEAGGTWISVDNLGSASSTSIPRYAIVLNFEIEHEEYPFGSVRGKRKRAPNRTLRSRGLLVRNFISNKTTPAEKYSIDVLKDRDAYRPFNLIVSDASGTFYTSSSHRQHYVERLQPGRLYAISNGYLYDRWEKTGIGKYFIELALVEELKVCSNGNRNAGSSAATQPDESISIPLKATHRMRKDTLRSTVLKLAEVMQTDTPLADPVFGRKSVPAMQLSAVFVRPTKILRKPLYKLIYLIRQVLNEIVSLYAHILKRFLKFFTGGRKPHPTGPATAPSQGFMQMIALWIYSIVELSLYQQASYVNLPGGKWLCPDADLFGTRTITIMCLLPPVERPLPISNEHVINDPMQSTPMEVPSAEDTHCALPIHQSNSVTRNVPAVCVEPSAYYILERDLDTQRMEWSNQEFTNVADKD